MPEKIIVSQFFSETRVALLENGRAAEVFIERKSEERLKGQIFKGTVTRVLPGINAAFVDIGLPRAGFLYGGDVKDQEESISDDVDAWVKNSKPINEILHEGQHILVQVSKERLGTKGPRVTMDLAIPGRYLVFVPYAQQVAISRRIQDVEERERLRALVEPLLPSNAGLIIRTAASGVSTEVLREDLAVLLDLWKEIEERIATLSAPAEVFRDLTMTERIIRDLCSEDTEHIIVDNPETFDVLERFMARTLPDALGKLKLYTGKAPIFDSYGIEVDLSGALSSRVELPSGGYLIIEQMEALTSFDVNTGRFIGNTNAEHTILKTNLEAIPKIVEQLRLRNIGGIIIVDFIDMERSEDRNSVYNRLLLELQMDRAKTKVLPLSEFGLVQITRQRTAESLEQQLLSHCPYCVGRGRIRSTQTEAYDLLREVVRFTVQNELSAIEVTVRQDIKDWILHHESDILAELRERFGAEITFKPAKVSFDLLRETAFEVDSNELD